jgi:hypothetical protein
VVPAGRLSYPEADGELRKVAHDALCGQVVHDVNARYERSSIILTSNKAMAAGFDF